MASIGPNLLIKRMELCTRLWEAGVKAEFLAQPKPNMDKQLTYALEEGIPFMVSAGADDIERWDAGFELRFSVCERLGVMQETVQNAGPTG